MRTVGMHHRSGVTMVAVSLASERLQSRTLALVAAALFVALWSSGPIAQWPDYHAFADTRAWLGIPNAANVLSNLPFAVIGGWGLWRLLQVQRSVAESPARPAWLLLCAALVCTAGGSALYHLAPDNASLVTDRLPIAWACATLLCGFLAERIHARWAAPTSLALALGVATLSVAWWWWTEQQHSGDLRAYLYVQFLPMALVPLALCMRQPTPRATVVPASTWWLVLGLYAGAKGLEMADHWVFHATQFASGHMFKHLLAAGAAAALVSAVIRGDQLR
jgi:hypothetical protein